MAETEMAETEGAAEPPTGRPGRSQARFAKRSARLAPPDPAVADRPPSTAFSQPWLVAGLAVAIGLAIDTVALHQPPGFGLMVGMWIALAVAASVSWLLGEPRPAGLAPILFAGLLMASFIGIRTSPVLLSLNLGATIGVMAVLAQLHKAGDTDHIEQSHGA